MDSHSLNCECVKIGKDATYKMAKSLCKMMDVETINEFGKWCGVQNTPIVCDKISEEELGI